MKKILNLVIVALAAMLISGCAGSSTMVKVPGVNPDRVTIWDQDEGKGKVHFVSERKYYSLENGTKRDKYAKGVKIALNAAALYGLSKGYTYLAVINNGINNLSGFPLNNFETLSRYLKLEDRKGTHFKVRTEGSEGHDFLIKSGVTLQVIFMKNKVPGLFLWDLQKLRRDTL